MTKAMISVSRTYLPPLKEYNKYLKKIWQSNWLTNNGELVQELERRIKKRIKAKHVICVSSGTSALMIAAKALGIKDKIYVSPFNYIATISAMVWQGIKPIFVDIDEEFTKGPTLSTHVYGIPSFVHVRPVIYDASHAFPFTCGGKSILLNGDISIVSLHATKTFQAAEGGLIVTNNDRLAHKARYMRNFGFKTRYSFWGTGINCKMSEFHAAMGLCSLKRVDETMKVFAKIIKKYNDALGYSHYKVTYYPIWYSSEYKLKKAIKEFEKKGIYPRRYFYPPLNKVFGGKECPVAEDVSKRVICLPLYRTLKDEQVNEIIKIAERTL
jgi:dTDP-4-amino-4,6-dideoxygalactose transaminase